MLSFHWIVKGRLAGSGRPGMFEPMDRDLDWLMAQGIRLIISLTEEPLAPLIDRPKLEYLHFPIPDMGVPTLAQAATLHHTVGEALDDGKPVLLHCKAGLGRTGMILACCLSHFGHSAEDAVVRVRLVNPSFIQTEGQESFVHDFARHLSSPGVRAPGGELPRLKLPDWAGKPRNS